MSSEKVKPILIPKIEKGVHLPHASYGSKGAPAFRRPFADMAHGDSFFAPVSRPNKILQRFAKWRKDDMPERAHLRLATRVEERDGVEGYRCWLIDTRIDDAYTQAANTAHRPGNAKN